MAEIRRTLDERASLLARPASETPARPAEGSLGRGWRYGRQVLRYITLSEVARVIILGSLMQGSYNSVTGYRLLTDRSFVCAWYYSAIDPADPSRYGPYPCRQPQIERTLARFSAVLGSVCGLASTTALLFLSKNMRKFGTKRLLMVNSLACLIFTKLPSYVLPMGAPIGPPDPWISPVASMIIFSISDFLYSISGGMALCGLVIRSMLCDIAPPSELGRVLSRFFVSVFIAVSIAPMLVVGFTRWTDHKYGQAAWTASSETPASPPHGSPTVPAPTPPADPQDEGAHHPHAFLAGILVDVIVLLWAIFFVRDTTPETARSHASPRQEDDTIERMARDSQPIAKRLRQGLRSALETLRPIAVFLPRVSVSEDGKRTLDWTYTKITSSLTVGYGFILLGNMLFEYVSYQYGYAGEEMSIIVSATCALTSIVVVLGIPAIYPWYEKHTRRPVVLRDLTQLELKALGDDIDALEAKKSAGDSNDEVDGRDEERAHLINNDSSLLVEQEDTTNEHHHQVRIGSHFINADLPADQLSPADRKLLNHAFSLWRFRVELLCARFLLVMGTLPYVVISALMTVLDNALPSTGNILLVMCLFLGLANNSQGPTDAAAVAMIRAQGGTTEQRDNYIAAVSFGHQVMFCVAPLFGSVIYGATLTTHPEWLYYLVVVGLGLAIVMLPVRARY
ncbi:hypothetical protein OC842_003261 [Tilletia horrida]|uniref:Uncharacterized protein n=1 Tax=Tilletia horrida TaxID=155126 RepID=A0AAN6JKC2_9BASI|nr:hypothetical protein OC842_003261 [Tilletia horrida]